MNHMQALRLLAQAHATDTGELGDAARKLLTDVHGWQSVELCGDYPGDWQRLGLGLGVYYRQPDGEEAVYLAAPGLRQPGPADIEGAIRFLGVLKSHLEASTHAG